jgi:hypothetical protein
VGAVHKELAEVDAVSVILVAGVEGVGDDPAILFEEHGLVVVGEESAHALVEPLEGVRGVAVAFILGELAVHPREQGDIIKRGEAVVHRTS